MFAPRSLLSTESIELRPVLPGDAERLRAWRRDSGFGGPCPALPWPPPDDRLEAMLRPGDLLRAFLFSPPGGEPAGLCALLGLDWKNRHAALAWAGAGTGLPAALGALAAFAFRELGLERLEAEVYGGDPAEAILVGLGFAREAVRREAARRAGAFVDVGVWGLLREEWRP